MKMKLFAAWLAAIFGSKANGAGLCGRHVTSTRTVAQDKRQAKKARNKRKGA